MTTPTKKTPTPSRAKKPPKRKPRTTPAAAAAASTSPAPAPARRWYEHPLASPVIWTIISAIVGGIIYKGTEIVRYASELMPVSTPAPFQEDQVGILLARLENDPKNEYALRVRSALEHQFPVSTDGSSSVEVSLYPKKLKLPEDGHLSENLASANAEGLTWLDEQNADLLIWGRALPDDKMLELRILTKEAQTKSPSGRPALYPIVIPSEFSEQVGAALAGMVAGAGAGAWNQRGGYLSAARVQELTNWMERLENLRDELPQSLDAQTRQELEKQIATAHAQIGAALLADGNDPQALKILEDVFSADMGEGDGILTTNPFLAAEIIADVVSQSSPAVQYMGPAEARTMTALAAGVAETFEEKHAAGELDDNEYAYLMGLISKLDGELRARTGNKDEAKARLERAIAYFKSVLEGLPKDQDALSRARIQSYLGEAQMALAQQLDAAEAATVLDESIENFKDASAAVSPKSAPRETVRFNYQLAVANIHRAEWFVDIDSLNNGIDQLNATLPILEQHQRMAEHTNTAIQLAGLLAADAVLSSGAPGAKKSLETLDIVKLTEQSSKDIAKACEAVPEGEQANCVDEQKVLAVQAKAGVERVRCLAHIAAALRYDPDGTPLSKPALEQADRAMESCAAAGKAMLKLGNAAGWVEATVMSADAHRLIGERQKDAGQLEEALKKLNLAQEKLAAIEDPVLTAQAAMSKAATIRTLGMLQEDPARVQEAVQLQLAARNLYEGKDFAIQRLYAEAELAQSLTSLSDLQGTDEGLDEAIELLTNAQDRYASGGAKLAAKAAANDLKEAERVKSKLTTN